MACAGAGGCSIDSPLRKPNACGVAVWMCSDRGFKKLLRLRFAQFREEVHLVIFLCSLPGCYLKFRDGHLCSGIFHHHHSHDHHHHHHDSFLRTIYFHGLIYHDIFLKEIVMVDRLFSEELLQRVWPSCGLCSPGSDLCSCGMCSRIRSSRNALGCVGIAGGVFF